MRLQMLLRQRERDAGEEEGTWHLREVEKWALPRPVREDRTEDMREEGKVPEWQGQATVTISDSEKWGKSPKLGLGLNA